MNAFKNGQLIRYRLSNGGTNAARVDFTLRLEAEYDAAGAIEWVPCTADNLPTPLLVHVDDIVSHEQAQAERDAAHRAR